MNKKSCVIIGAGLAGLAAGYWLKKKHWQVTLLEARTRLGGRVFTHRFDENPDLYCELGGEWVGKHHERIQQLCKHFKLTLIPHLFDTSFAERGKIVRILRAGRWPFAPKLDKVLKQAVTTVLGKNDEKQAPFDRQDWWTFLREVGFSRKDLLRRDLMDSTDFGESIRHVGAVSGMSEYYEAYKDKRTRRRKVRANPTNAMDMRIEGGNSRLVVALAKAIGFEAIHTGRKVTEIRQAKGEVTVFTEDTRTMERTLPTPPRTSQRRLSQIGGRVTASYCICTVPARVLTDIRFVPDLPLNQRETALDLQYARIMKTVLLFQDRFWLKKYRDRFSCFTDRSSDFIFDATLGQGNILSGGILCSYAIGDKADDLAARGREQLREAIAHDLAVLFPDKDTEPIAIARYAWQEDTNTQGAYALYRPGQFQVVQAALKKPHDKVYFAGEHLAEEQGFMEGAIDSGEEVAKAIHQGHA